MRSFANILKFICLFVLKTKPKSIKKTILIKKIEKLRFLFQYHLVISHCTAIKPCGHYLLHVVTYDCIVSVYHLHTGVEVDSSKSLYQLASVVSLKYESENLLFLFDWCMLSVCMDMCDGFSVAICVLHFINYDISRVILLFIFFCSFFYLLLFSI